MDEMGTDFLVPSGGFLLSLALYLAVLVIAPAIDAGGQGRWWWVVAIVLLSPFAGLLWFAFRWSRPKRQMA